VATVVRSNPQTILPVIRTQLVAVTGLPLVRVGLIARDPPPPMQADQEILLRLKRRGGNKDWLDGMGRIASLVESTLEVTVRNRVALDETNRDLQWLADEAYGIFALEDLVWDALHGFLPLDASDNWLVTEELKFLPDNGPLKDRKDPAAWGESTLAFSLHYLLRLEQRATV
jgi:hypothetical protein